MKKLASLLLCLTLVGCNTIKQEVKSTQPAGPVEQKVYKNIEKKTLKEVVDRAKGGEAFVLAVLNKNCSHCNDFKDYIELQKLENKILFVDTDDEDTRKGIKQVFPQLTVTPTIIKFEKGEVKNVIIGFDKDEVNKLLNLTEVKKEGN